MSFPRDNYPYTNFHELNLGYFIVHFREIFSQWADLYDQMLSWKDATDEELATWKAGVEADLDQREAALRAELETWKAQTGQDIAGWEDATLAALTAWQTATQAVFEAIRVEAAGSATAAAASATDAATAKTAAETAQAAAEAAAASVQASAAQITTNADDIADLKTQLGRLGRSFSDTSLWVPKSINAASGGFNNADKTISTLNPISRYITRITRKNTAIFAIFVWNDSGVFQGCWNEETETYQATNKFNVDADLTKIPINYSIRISCRDNPTVDITTDFAANIVFHTDVDDTLSIMGAAADAKKTGDRLASLENNVTAINDFIHIPTVENTALNYFEDTDLSVDKASNSRGCTPIFTLEPGSYNVEITNTDYNYIVYGQKIVEGVQTTTNLTHRWTNGVSELTADQDYYRVVIRRLDQGSMISDDLSSVKMVFTKSDIYEPITDTLDTAVLHPTVPIFYDKENALKEAINSARDNNTIVFCLSTDNHYNSFDDNDCVQTAYAERISKIAKKIGASFIANLGDIIEGFNDHLTVDNYKQQYVNSERFIEMMRAFTDEEVPFMYTAGHHECYPISETTQADATLNNGDPFVQNRAFNSAELKPMAYGKGILARLNTTSANSTGYRKFTNKITDIADPNSNVSTLNNTGASLTYYVDVDSNSGNTVRFLFVDSTFFTQFGYDPDTVTFVSNALTDAASNNIPVIILSHIPLRKGQYAMNDSADARNETAYINAIKNSGANILAYIHGHVHGDNIVTAQTEREDTHTYPYADLSFPMVAVSCQKIYGSSGPYIGDFVTYGTRNKALYTGYCFDTILVHTNTGKIDFYRFGAGDSGTYPTRSVN